MHGYSEVILVHELPAKDVLLVSADRDGQVERSIARQHASHCFRDGRFGDSSMLMDSVWGVNMTCSFLAVTAALLFTFVIGIVNLSASLQIGELQGWLEFAVPVAYAALVLNLVSFVGWVAYLCMAHDRAGPDSASAMDQGPSSVLV